MANLRREVQNAIAEGVGLIWESYKLDPYVQKLAELVTSFQEKVDDLLVTEEQIDIDVRFVKYNGFVDLHIHDSRTWVFS